MVDQRALTPNRYLLTEVVVALATIESAGAHAALLESDARNRKDRGRCDRASRRVPSRRGQLENLDAPASRMDIPLLRLLLGSKGMEVVECAIVSHDTPPQMR